MKVPPDRHGDDAEAADQHLPDEILRRKARQSGIEGKLNHALKCLMRQQKSLFARRRQSRNGQIGAEKASGVRLKGHGQRRQAPANGLFPCGGQNGLMAKMNPIEIADSDHPPCQGGGNIV
ncbi:hypothetical protein IZ6_24010 [Terrihabitans soli]|uniref:Uncharacterized protein n=1 Tax=Terrihabitans soli TaxID=708113 RepID=A0A6S6QQ67_9HYPH|nr:hypothetical protein IZ6_24010 [Terrihabitans soli]